MELKQIAHHATQLRFGISQLIPVRLYVPLVGMKIQCSTSVFNVILHVLHALGCHHLVLLAVLAIT